MFLEGWQSIGVLSASAIAYSVLWAEGNGIILRLPLVVRRSCIMIAPVSIRQLFFISHIFLRQGRTERLIGSPTFRVSFYDLYKRLERMP